MNTQEITFNTSASNTPRTDADFTYNITPMMISITDTGLDKCPVTEDIEAVLRKIEYWHQGSIADFNASVVLGQVLLCLWHMCNDPELLEHPQSVP